jgi:NTP pyrophosphatase (non-canonical NTP hydrolase)
MHSELSEALEGVRKGLKDDKLPHRSMEEVELVDCIIRILDYAGGFNLDLQGAFDEKMAYNAKRKDHTHEARLADGGKKF